MWVGTATLIVSGFSLQVRSVRKNAEGQVEGVIFAVKHLGRLIREQSRERNFSLVLSFGYKRKNKRK